MKEIGKGPFTGGRTNKNHRGHPWEKEGMADEKKRAVSARTSLEGGGVPRGGGVGNGAGADITSEKRKKR